MQDFDVVKITELEQLVREEFATFFGSAENVFESVDKIHILGFYGNNVSRFRFLPGHRSDMAKLAPEVKTRDSSYYNMPIGYKVPRKNIVRTPIGYLYGSKTRTQGNIAVDNFARINLAQNASNPNNSAASGSKQSNSTTSSDTTPSETTSSESTSGESTPNESVPSEPTATDSKSNESVPRKSDHDEQSTKSKVMLRINVMLQPFQMTLEEKDISFVGDGSKVTAYVVCKPCAMENKKKNIAVQYETSRVNSCQYWNFSNFNKHLKKHLAAMRCANEPKEESNDSAKQPVLSADNEAPQIYG